jgi:hypothetical protein
LGYTAGSNPDAMYTRIFADINAFVNWCNQYGKKGVIGEVSWPNNGDSDAAGDQAKWNALGAAYLAECDRIGLNVDAWSCGEFYGAGTSDPLVIYTASGGGSTGINTQKLHAATFEADL